MAEVDVDLSAEHPKPLTDASVEACDVVVTLGAVMPAGPGAAGRPAPR